MQYYEIPEKIKAQFHAWWNMENDTPLLSVYARGENHMDVSDVPQELEERWRNEEYLLESEKNKWASTYCGGVAFPVYNPNLGPDILGACTGYNDIKFGEDTSWAIPKIEDLNDIDDIQLDENNPWWKKIVSMTRSAVEGSGGKFFVGMTDLHPGTDGLVSIRGAQNLCYDLIDCPEAVDNALRKITEFYKDIYTRLADVLDAEKSGYTTWNNIWSDVPYYIVSSDFSAMIGTEDYERFVAPHIEGEIGFLKHSIYHLDGPAALRHLDRILAMENLNGVQWVPGAGNAPMRDWIHVLKRIQEAGKIIEVSVTAQDIKPLCDNLNPQGLCMRIDADSVEEAKELENLVSKYRVRKFY